MVHRGRGRRHGPAGSRGVRCRWWAADEQRWNVNARVERFVEPALLLVLRDVDESHGYELAEAVEAIDTDERVDLGNLYRLLRGLEEDGFVASTWRDDLPGRTKRTYRLTAEGRTLLDTWAAALRDVQATIDGFLRRHEEGAST